MKITLATYSNGSFVGRESFRSFPEAIAQYKRHLVPSKLGIIDNGRKKWLVGDTTSELAKAELECSTPAKPVGIYLL